MSESKQSFLFLEENLDLGHLKLSHGKYEFNSTFCQSSEIFIEECNKERFDLLIISGVGTDVKNLTLLDSLYISKNSDTPILFIVDNSSVPPVQDLLNYQIDIICFPFTTEEFMFRVHKILRSAETEMNIDRSLKSYKKLFDILPMGIIQTDEHGKFIKTNPGVLSIINIEEKDLYAENFFQLCHPDDYFLERKQLDRLLRKEIKCVDYEIRLINNEGKTAVCSVEATILWSAPDIFNSFVFVLRLVS